MKESLLELEPDHAYLDDIDNLPESTVSQYIVPSSTSSRMKSRNFPANHLFILAPEILFQPQEDARFVYY